MESLADMRLGDVHTDIVMREAATSWDKEEGLDKC